MVFPHQSPKIPILQRFFHIFPALPWQTNSIFIILDFPFISLDMTRPLYHMKTNFYITKFLFTRPPRTACRFDTRAYSDRDNRAAALWAVALGFHYFGGFQSEGYISIGIEKKNRTPSDKFSAPYSKSCMDKICATMARPNPEPLYFASLSR